MLWTVIAVQIWSLKGNLLKHVLHAVTTPNILPLPLTPRIFAAVRSADSVIGPGPLTPQLDKLHPFINMFSTNLLSVGHTVVI